MPIFKTISKDQISLKDSPSLHIILIEKIDDLKNIFLPSPVSFIELKTVLEKEKYNFSGFCLTFFTFFHNGVTHHLAIAGIEKKEGGLFPVYTEKIRNICGQLTSFMQTKKIAESFFSLSCHSLAEIMQLKLIEEITVAISLASYHFDFYLCEAKRKFQNFMVYLITPRDLEKKYDAAIKKGLIIGQSVNFSRSLSDTPASDLYPESFIEKVKKQIADNHLTNCKIEIITLSEMKTLGMGGLIAVGQGSSKEPHLLVLSYTPDALDTDTKTNKTIALIGKGVTFDTGGISIKPAENMEDMKADMSGAAAVVSSFIALCQLKTPYILYAVAPLAENMLDGNAYRPGDIITFYNKKTAEIKNTDAEGRLILADALAYVSQKYHPDYLIDLATLTGACRIALGPIYAGLMSESDTLVNAITAAGEITQNKCWRLPLEDSYLPNMSSDVADMCNIGTKGYKAGATMGGMFLREFVDKNIQWAHIDIATVATDCPHKQYLAKYGATGFGVQLLIELLEQKTYLK